MNSFTKSKTSLFLMEFILTILLFAICATVCMRLFAESNLISRKTKELNNSVACAQGFAEVMRGTDGSLEAILAYYPGAAVGDDNYFEVFYDDDFNQCDYIDARYVADVTLTPNGAVQNMEINIVRIIDYEKIYTLNATKYMNEAKG